MMSQKKVILLSVLLCTLLFAISCHTRMSSHDQMVSILRAVKNRVNVPQNEFSSPDKLHYTDSLLEQAHNPGEITYCKFLKGHILMELGETENAVSLYEEIVDDVNRYQIGSVWKDMAIANFRVGEQTNCISNHASASCILPIKGLGIHRDAVGSRKAIKVYEKILEKDPQDLESRWLLNLAYMTLAEYPEKVPARFLIPGMEEDTTYKVKPFMDIASDLHIEVNNMAGGSIVEDFDNDGYLDIVTSGWGLEEIMHYFKNNANGTFSEIASSLTGLNGITGGLNMMQTDYNNDGNKDIFVLRGAWKGAFGREPNSLIRNNGDGTFTDVTVESKMLSFHPTQTATWNDFNNDGWLDVFIGNETSRADIIPHPCELYINNQDGTFREVALVALCDYTLFVKGVTSGDFNNDGWKDIFISTMDGVRKLLKNKGISGNEITFEDVTAEAGLFNERGKTFPTWFWDYDNDGWLDIFACDYTFQKSLGYYEAAEKLNIVAGSPEKMLLYHNNHDGTFTNVSNEAGLNTNAFAMGSNFGDIDNDGFLDMYLGTGNPNYQSLVPNKMFKSLGGKKFADVTASARVGHLQKGHGVSFADMDNDGDQDIYIEMGGAFPGDAYQNSFFLNPGQNDNKWICLQLEGTETNRAAIGTRVKITFRENGMSRSVYRDVNSGGSFGASPLRREIGIGSATLIDEIEIRWHGVDEVQIFRNVKPNQFLKIVQGVNELKTVPIKTFQWTLPELLCDPIAFSDINIQP